MKLAESRIKQRISCSAMTYCATAASSGQCTIVALSLILLVQLLAPQFAFGAESKHTTLIVLLDGLRADALNPQVTPNLLRLAREGVRSEMTPIWPAISRPNHWGMVTGLDARHSGVFHNDMYNPATGRLFSFQDPNWAHGEPIWATLAKQGRVSGVVGGWTGAQLTDGRGPSFYIPGTYPPSERDRRAALVLELLDQPAFRRPDLLALYFPDIDVDQHHDGVGSPKAVESLKRADRMIGELREGLSNRGLAGSVMLVVVADHGSMNVESEDIVLSDYLDTGSLSAPPVGGGPVFAIWPKAGEEDAIYQKLTRAHPHLHAYRAGEFPPELACCHADRTPPILLLSDPGWSMEIVRPEPAQRLRATHGFDSRLPAMKAIFLAAGPAIKPGAHLAPFETIHVYSLLAALTGVQPNPNDGSVRPFCGVLVNPPNACSLSQELGVGPREIDQLRGRYLEQAFRAPYSELASDASRRHFVEFAEGFERWRSMLKPGDSIGTVRNTLDDTLMRPGVERLRAAFPVEIVSRTIGAVRTDVVTPVAGVSARNRKRVLINLHGGGFTVGGGYGGQQESIPISSLGRITVVSVDYRMAPEHRFPAASEDVARVYGELLKTYRAENIGIYGCSAGAYLTGEAVAWFQEHGLPRPGAVGLFGGSLITGQAGDSDVFGAVLGGMGSRPRQQGEASADRRVQYFDGADLRDPLVSPGLSAELLRRFPPSLLISGTRDMRLSQTVHAHAQLVKNGVDARLHVWEGAAHCAFAQPIVDPNVPETREAWDVIVRFFDEQLGSTKHQRAQ